MSVAQTISKLRGWARGQQASLAVQATIGVFGLWVECYLRGQEISSDALLHKVACAAMADVSSC